MTASPVQSPAPQNVVPRLLVDIMLFGTPLCTFHAQVLLLTQTTIGRKKTACHHPEKCKSDAACRQWQSRGAPSAQAIVLAVAATYPLMGGRVLV